MLESSLSLSLYTRRCNWCCWLDNEHTHICVCVCANETHDPECTRPDTHRHTHTQSNSPCKRCKILFIYFLFNTNLKNELELLTAEQANVLYVVNRLPNLTFKTIGTCVRPRSIITKIYPTTTYIQSTRNTTFTGNQ